MQHQGGQALGPPVLLHMQDVPVAHRQALDAKRRRVGVKGGGGHGADGIGWAPAGGAAPREIDVPCKRGFMKIMRCES